MREFFKSEKAIILLAFVFTFMIALYNVYDFSVDKSNRYSYTSSEAQNYPVELVNINTAGVEELCELPGVGEKTAQIIIDYREENEGFNSIAEIKEVLGIGDTDFAKIRSLITI